MAALVVPMETEAARRERHLGMLRRLSEVCLAVAEAAGEAAVAEARAPADERVVGPIVDRAMAAEAELVAAVAEVPNGEDSGGAAFGGEALAPALPRVLREVLPRWSAAVVVARMAAAVRMLIALERRVAAGKPVRSARPAPVATVAGAGAAGSGAMASGDRQTVRRARGRGAWFDWAMPPCSNRARAVGPPAIGPP